MGRVNCDPYFVVSILISAAEALVSLPSGIRFGSCEVLTTLGVGGMGEVNRAGEARLGHDLAINVLPHGFVEDRDRLQRFEREAEALAAPSHPNLSSVHGQGTHDRSLPKESL